MKITNYQAKKYEMQAYPNGGFWCGLVCGGGCLAVCLATLYLGAALVATLGITAADSKWCGESGDPQ